MQASQLAGQTSSSAASSLLAALGTTITRRTLPLEAGVLRHGTDADLELACVKASHSCPSRPWACYTECHHTPHMLSPMLLAMSRNPDAFPSNFLSRQVWAVPPALAHQGTSEHVYKVRPGVPGKH